MSSQDKVDIFIVAHLMGYWCKTLIFRDWWLTTVISIMFEFLEYRWGELGLVDSGSRDHNTRL